MTSKPCQRCATTFPITAADGEFYDRIDVPEPTHCPDCRQQRRLAWRNERKMYRRTCDFSGKNIISMYPPDCPFPVYDQSIWWGDQWDALSYGRTFDFNRPFFDQFRELQLQVPRLALVNKQSENAQFTNHAGKNKSCYLSGCIFGCEDVLYSDWIMDCKDLVDCSYMLEGCERCYETYYAWGCQGAFFCDFVKRCYDVWFCYDCIGCRDCFLCSNLRNKQYCYQNKQLTKEEYERRISNLFPLSYAALQQLQDQYRILREQNTIYPETVQLQAIDSTGDLLFGAQNAHACFDCIDMEDSAYCYDTIDVHNSMDLYHVGWAQLMYECHAISNGYNCKFCHFTYDNKNATYCDCTQNCTDVFGCCGLYQKQYCILNKQYSKEEYEALVPQIIEHMKKTSLPLAPSRKEGGLPPPSGEGWGGGREKIGGEVEWGEFFPMHFSPFAYNQSRAQEYYPLNKETAEKQQVRWSNYKSEDPQATKVIPSKQLPETIDSIPDDVTNWALLCEATGHPYKLIQQEVDFYRSARLPIPRRCPDQRFDDRMAMRNPRTLWQRHCTQCQRQIQSSFHPDRKEAVYCRECYEGALY